MRGRVWTWVRAGATRPAVLRGVGWGSRQLGRGVGAWSASHTAPARGRAAWGSDLTSFQLSTNQDGYAQSFRDAQNVRDGGVARRICVMVRKICVMRNVCVCPISP